MGVSQFGCDVESEILTVLNSGVTKTNANGTTLFERLLQQQRLQKRIQFFACEYKSLRVVDTDNHMY